MAVDRTVGAQYAQRIIDLYATVEEDLARIIARGVERNVERDDLSRKLLQLSEIRRAAEAAMRKIDGKLSATVRQALHDAAVAGGRKAQEDLLRLRDRRAVGRRLVALDRNLINSPSLLRLAASLSPGLEQRLRSTHLQVVRSAGDIYQQAVAAMAAPSVLAGVLTRREAAQKALDHLWQRGITGFTDKAGRHWNLASYVEMATRTTTAHAAVQSHLDELTQSGIDLVQVSADGAPCPACRPWEGDVLINGGTPGERVVSRQSEMADEQVNVFISGSVSEAIAAGLLHPSCRHTLNAYLPGATRDIPTAGDGAEVYRAEQIQRRLEREARRIAVEQAGAIEPARQRELAAEYRAKRAQIAQHVKDNPKLRRKTERERVDLGHSPSASQPIEAKTTPPVKPKALKAAVVPKVEAPVEVPKPRNVEEPKVAPRRATFEQPILTEAQLRGVYGPRLSITRGYADPERLKFQLDGLGRINESLHRRMNQFFSEKPDGGIYIGPGGVLGVAPESVKHELRGCPRGYPDGSTWASVNGVYMPSDRVLLVSEDKHDMRSGHSTMQHEFGHSVDSLHGKISQTPEYRDIYRQICSGILVKPYFSITGNPGGYHAESFAELFNAYAATRGKPEVDTIKMILHLLGISRYASDIAHAVANGPAEEARLTRLAAESLTGMRRIIAMFDKIYEEK